ncbi:hypothetical protein D3C71_1798970 [compost metagenome]
MLCAPQNIMRFDVGLFFNNFAFAPDRLATCVEAMDDAIAVGVASADPACLDAAPDTAMGF